MKYRVKLYALEEMTSGFGGHERKHFNTRDFADFDTMLECVLEHMHTLSQEGYPVGDAMSCVKVYEVKRKKIF